MRHDLEIDSSLYCYKKDQSNTVNVSEETSFQIFYNTFGAKYDTLKNVLYVEKIYRRRANGLP